MIGRWLLSTMIAFNQFGNALLGGQPDESISSRLGNARTHGSKGARFACVLLEAVDFHSKERGDHCTVAVETHKARTATAAERAQR